MEGQEWKGRGNERERGEGASEGARERGSEGGREGGKEGGREGEGERARQIESQRESENRPIPKRTLIFGCDSVRLESGGRCTVG